MSATCSMCMRPAATSRAASPGRCSCMRLHSYKSSGNCLKVRILLGLLDQPFELVETDIFAGDTLTDAFARLNPLRETPVLELDDGSTLAQSNAILQFLAEGTPLAGRTRQERAQATAWCC